MTATPSPTAQAPVDEVVATLVLPSDYLRHLKQVVTVTQAQLVIAERKFVSRAGYELVRVPLADCATLEHHDERPLGTIVSGLLLAAVVAVAAIGVVVSWNDLQAGTRVPVGALALAGAWGVRRVFGARRHRLVFVLRDGRRLTWRSRPGDYEGLRRAVDSVLDHARALGLLRGSSLVRG